MGSRRVVVFTGAGVSTESGIPDFRGPQGLWTKVDPNQYTLQRWLADPEHRKRVFRERMERPQWTGAPNPSHTALVALHEHGRLLRCVTQNIDGLHQAAGLPDELVLEVHGTAHRVMCLRCDARTGWEGLFARLRAGEDDPQCEECGGVLKSATVSFGQNLPPAVLDQAFDDADTCDLMVAAGSTLSVYPAAYVPLRAARRGVPFVIVNEGDTDADTAADIRLEGKTGTLLPALFEA